MAARIYALLVGINHYPPGVRDLGGCLNDVDDFERFLRSRADDPAHLAIEVLKDEDATRANIVERFRAHLGRAQDGDIALFQFAGHGARSTSNAAFREVSRDGHDEGLVCHDSRQLGGHDLADKELAVLIAEVARRDAQVAVLLDCCHSGSGTRNAVDLSGLAVRETAGSRQDRPLESYLDGHYARLHESNKPLFVPTGRHILLAACDRSQTAKESQRRRGIFSSTLLDVLERSRADLTYTELFTRCRASVRTLAANQDPQFEAFAGFDAERGFLGRRSGQRRPRFTVTWADGIWSADCGAIHGLPTAPEAIAGLTLYRDDEAGTPAGAATVVNVKPSSCDLRLAFEANRFTRFAASLTSLPVAPMPVDFSGDAAMRNALQQALDADRSVPVVLTDDIARTRYALVADGDRITLLHGRTRQPIAFAARSDPPAQELLPALAQVAEWERALALQNLRTAMDVDLVEMIFVEQTDGDGERVHAAASVTLDYRRRHRMWSDIHGRIRARNRTDQPVHVALFYLSPRFGIKALFNECLDPVDEWVTLLGASPDDFFDLPNDVDEAVDIFKLVVSTERLDDFLLVRDDLDPDHAPVRRRHLNQSSSRPKLVHANEWFTKTLALRIVRQCGSLTSADVTLAEGRIVLRGHPTLRADVNLGAIGSSPERVDDIERWCRVLEDRGLSLVDFAGDQGGGRSVLEFSHLRGADTVPEHPLVVDVKLALADGEELLPLAFDDGHVMRCGSSLPREDGWIRVTIDAFADVHDTCRGAGRLLKLYFFLSDPRRAEAAGLRWVEWTSGRDEVGMKGAAGGARRVMRLAIDASER